MTWSLASGFLYVHPDWSVWSAIGTALAGSLLFFVSVLLHELARALVARRFGLVVRSITLFLLVGVSNIEQEPPSANAEFWIAVVGPVLSIVLGIILLWVAWLTVHVPSHLARSPYAVMARLHPGESLLLWLGTVNGIVGVFNLIPAFPLDGGRLLRSSLWASTGSLHRATRRASMIGQGVGCFLVLMGIASAFGAKVPLFGPGLISGLWLAFLGWFVAAAATATWKRQLVHEILGGVTVSRLMRPPTWAVPLDTALSHVGGGWALQRDDCAFAVVGDRQRLMGIVSLVDLSKAPREAWESTRVADVMTPLDQLVTATARESVGDALQRMMQAGVRQLPVVDGERLEGMLARSDNARWIELHRRDWSAHVHAH